MTFFADAVTRIERNASEGADTRIKWRGYAFHVRPRGNGLLRVYKHRHDWMIPDDVLLGTVDNARDAIGIIERA